MLVESRLVTGDIASLRIGQAVALVVESIAADDGESIKTYAFMPADETNGGRR